MLNITQGPAHIQLLSGVRYRTFKHLGHLLAHLLGEAVQQLGHVERVHQGIKQVAGAEGWVLEDTNRSKHVKW